MQMAASFVEKGKIVCDVGCDHGKLALYLIQSGRAQHIFATDINPKPLQKAVDLFADNKLEQKADFFLTDGLQNIPASRDITHVVIAGMGGGNMAQIIENAPFIAENKVKLVLLPAQKGYIIRRYLYQNGFEINFERPVEEKGKFYSCMQAVYTGNPFDADIYDIYVGKSGENTGSAALGYLKLVYSRLKNTADGIAIDRRQRDVRYTKALEKLENLIHTIEK